MYFLILKILTIWVLVALGACLAFGAAIRRGERIRKDIFLNCVFASLESQGDSRR